MTHAAQSTRPFVVLRDAIRSLEAAVLACEATPKKKHVHRLRTWTRRIEAQLELIAMLSGADSGSDSPSHESPPVKHRDRALRLLKKLRRAAGRVRDLDVERDLVAKEASRARGRSHAGAAIRDDARTLRRDLRRHRGKEADALLQLLKKDRKRLPLVLKRLLDALAPAKKVTLSEEKLIALVRDWFHRCEIDPIPSGAVELHAIRKRAKIARYLAESAPECAARAHRLARQFEDLQQVGGTWHDWLQLAELAAGVLGESSQLAQRFSVHADRALHIYTHKLTAARNPVAARKGPAIAAAAPLARAA